MKRIILIIILAAVVYGAMNFDFFRKNIEYKIKKETGQSVEIPNPREKMQPNQLLIPALSIETPVLYAERVDEDHFQELLIEGVVHYPGTAKIGEPGNMYIFGHSSDNVWAKGNYKTVFALLPKIKKGDKKIAHAANFLPGRYGTEKICGYRGINQMKILPSCSTWAVSRKCTLSVSRSIPIWISGWHRANTFRGLVCKEFIIHPVRSIQITSPRTVRFRIQRKLSYVRWRQIGNPATRTRSSTVTVL